MKVIQRSTDGQIALFEDWGESTFNQSKLENWKRYGYEEVDYNCFYGKDGKWHKEGEEVVLPPLTAEQLDNFKKNYWKSNFDEYTTERTRKMSVDDWTPEDEAAYKAKSQEITAFLSDIKNIEEIYWGALK